MAILMSNGWLAGTVVPAACSSGVSPDFYNEQTGELFTCAGNVYVSVTASGAPQTPWASDINGNNHSLFAVTSLGVNTSFIPPNPGTIFVQTTTASRGPSESFINNLGNDMTIGFGGTLDSPTVRQNNGFFQSANDIVFGTGGSNNTMYVSRLGRVGINGQATPAFPLDVIGDINCTGVFRVNGVALTTGQSQTPWLSDIDAASFSLLNVNAINSSGRNADLLMEIAGGTGNSFRFRFLGGTNASFFLNESTFNGPGTFIARALNSGQNPALQMQDSAGANWSFNMDAALASSQRVELRFSALFPQPLLTFGPTAPHGMLGVGLPSGNSPVHLLELGVDDAAKPATNTWTVTSDIRVKQNSVALTDGLALIKQLNPFSAQYNGENNLPLGLAVIGLNAQDLQAIPATASWVTSVPGTISGVATDVLQVDTGPLIFVVVNALKELDARLTIAEGKLPA